MSRRSARDACKGKDPDIANARAPESCPYRLPCEAGGAEHYCDVVQQSNPLASHHECRVARSACVSCCASFAPTRSRPNEVLASLICESVCRAAARLRQPAEVVSLAESRAWATRFLASEQAAPPPAVTEPRVGAARRILNAARRRLSTRLRIGLVGVDNEKGLGHQNRDLARWLAVDRWLVPADSVVYEAGDRGGWRGTYERSQGGASQLDRWLHGLDIVLFVESPHFSSLPSRARRLGIRVAMVPNWERLHPGLDWLEDIDLMLCPTAHTEHILLDWRRRFGFAWTVSQTPWPIDVDYFRFRPRRVARQFVFVNGTGGMRGRRPDGTPSGFRRKGLEVLLEAACLVPQANFLLWSQTNDLPPLPDNVFRMRTSLDNRKLYEEGDVCVQTSHWEGLGLPLLECQAAGLPLITLAAPPMNEHHPLATISCAASELLYLFPHHPLVVPRPTPDEVAGVLAGVYLQDIGAASFAARQFVEQHHSWTTTRPRILELLATCATERRCP